MSGKKIGGVGQRYLKIMEFDNINLLGKKASMGEAPRNK